MTQPTTDAQAAESSRRPIVMLVGYYALLVGLDLALSRVSPWLGERLSGVPRVLAGGLDLSARVEPVLETAGEAFASAILTMAAAVLLVLPVVWVYTFARHKRGFQQSLAQTLVILPVVVAVVVVLVKHNVALAFSLGGIVGAVAFRHRLEDTKDAVYIFVTIAIGLAAGVQAYSVAFAASLFFNGVIIALWLTDFARLPAQLGSALASKRVLLAKGMATNRTTNEYVAHLDQQLLQSMTPDQLKALADRALERNLEYHETHDELPVAVPGTDGMASTVSARATMASGPGVRATIEAVLDREAKAWRFEEETPAGEGRVVVRYRVRCRKKVPAARLQESLRRSLGFLADEVTVL